MGFAIYCDKKKNQKLVKKLIFNNSIKGEHFLKITTLECGFKN